MLSRNISLLLIAGILSFSVFTANAQREGSSQNVRVVSVPISIVTREELRARRADELIEVDQLIVRENRREQQILSIRSIADAPLSLAILIQDNLTTSANLQLRDIADFIRKLPRGSRVMVGYLRSGTMEIRQGFTTDLDEAAASLRIISGSATGGPNGPYSQLVDAMNRFDGLPAGRRAVILVSDGLDLSQGFWGSSPLSSIDLERAITSANRRSVAVFSIFNPTAITDNGNPTLILNGQGSLARLAEETGGRAFFTGSMAPVTFDPFFRELALLLDRQFYLTYLSPNMRRGYYRVEIITSNPDVTILHPRGYNYR
jgi:VWFA-related protein